MVGLSAGRSVDRGAASGCVQSVQTYAFYVRTIRTWASAPRTEVYVICACNIRCIGCTGRMLLLFADAGGSVIFSSILLDS